MHLKTVCVTKCHRIALYNNVYSIKHLLILYDIDCRSIHLLFLERVFSFGVTLLVTRWWARQGCSDDTVHIIADRPQLPPVLRTQTSIPLSPWRLRYLARPFVWCDLNLDSSVMIQCRQWRMSGARWHLSHWRWCPGCTNVSLGHRAGLR